MSNTTVQNTLVGTLKVNLFDTAAKKLIWRGSASRAFSGNAERKRKEHQRSHGMFKKFPPKEKS